MRLCEDTLAHDGSQPIPAATHIVMEFGSPSEDMEDAYSHEYAVCAPCMEFLTSNKWINVEVVEELVTEEIIKGASLGVVQSSVTLTKRKPSTCAECGHRGTNVSSRPWFVPNQHDSGIVPICEPCWQDS